MGTVSVGIVPPKLVDFVETCHAPALGKNTEPEDGVIQVHEFISWLTSRKSAVKAVQDKHGTVTATITNTSDRASKRFTLSFNSCKNMSFPEGNPATFLLRPGEQVARTVCAVEEKGQAWKWRYRWTARAEFVGIEDEPNAFKDEGFQCDATSIGESSSQFSVGEPDIWARARLLGDPAEAVLFDQVRPQDVIQGSLGDCWLLSCLSCLAEHPWRIKALFPNARQLNDEGKYEVQLFDIATEAWTLVTIDEFVPCNIQNGIPVPTFARPLGEEIWVQLIEKAVAKFCGSYGALSGGGVGWAFQVMTGEVHILSFEKLSESLWRRRYMHREKQLARGPRNPRNSWWRWSNTDTHDSNQLFQLLMGHQEAKHIISCMIAGKEATAEQAKSNGLYIKHYYSLLDVVSETADDGLGVCLVLLRNPWGRKEWTGDWSDASERWEQNPQLRAKLDAHVRTGPSCAVAVRCTEHLGGSTGFGKRLMQMRVALGSYLEGACSKRSKDRQAETLALEPGAGMV